METQQCQNCGAPMLLYKNADESKFYKCPYCGNTLNIQKSASTLDKVLSFARNFIPKTSSINSEKERLIAIINDPSSTKEAVKYAKKELKRLNNERSGHY